MRKFFSAISVCLICLVCPVGFVTQINSVAAQSIQRPGDAPSAALDDRAAIGAAFDGIKSLMRQGLPVDGTLLEPEWGQVPDGDMKVSRKGKGFYIISILNKQDEARELFVLISDRGEIFDANFSGEFDGLVE